MIPSLDLHSAYRERFELEFEELFELEFEELLDELFELEFDELFELELLLWATFILSVASILRSVVETGAAACAAPTATAAVATVASAVMVIRFILRLSWLSKTASL